MTHAFRSSPDTLGGALRLDRAKLLSIVEPVARAHGAEISDVELTNEGGWILRVFVEKAGSAARKATTQEAAVDLELCAGLARDLSPALDVADLIPARYHLEVSSPGVERPLRDESDFDRFAGQKAKLKLRTPVSGQKVLVGVISAPTGGKVLVEDGGRSHEVSLDDVEWARLVFEFGPAPKPGKGPRAGRR